MKTMGRKKKPLTVKLPVFKTSPRKRKPPATNEKVNTKNKQKVHNTKSLSKCPKRKDDTKPKKPNLVNSKDKKHKSLAANIEVDKSKPESINTSNVLSRYPTRKTSAKPQKLVETKEKSKQSEVSNTEVNNNSNKQKSKPKKLSKCQKRKAQSKTPTPTKNQKLIEVKKVKKQPASRQTQDTKSEQKTIKTKMPTASPQKRRASIKATTQILKVRKLETELPTEPNTKVNEHQETRETKILTKYLKRKAGAKTKAQKLEVTKKGSLKSNVEIKNKNQQDASKTKISRGCLKRKTAKSKAQKQKVLESAEAETKSKQESNTKIPSKRQKRKAVESETPTSAKRQKKDGKIKTNGVDRPHSYFIKRHDCESSKQLFPNWKCLKEAWKSLQPSNYEEFLPPLMTSTAFKCQQHLHSKNVPWQTIDRFKSSFQYGSSSNCVLFAGGDVSCATWCPTPKSLDVSQFITLTTCADPAKNSQFTPGLIQIWSVNNPTKCSQSKTIDFKLGISHRFGKIWKMAWCPWGAWEKDTLFQSTVGIPRLGLLALACNDGCIRIYSVPHPRFLSGNSKRLPIYDASPVANLCNSFNHDSVMCTSLSWSSFSDCNKIVAGYSNGLISVFILSDEQDLIQLPILTFHAHGGAVSSVSFAPTSGNRWLTSSGYVDKTVKIWDTVENEIPVYTYKAGAKEIEWCLGLAGIFFINNSTHSTVGYIETDGKYEILSSHASPTMCFSTNINLGMMVHADMAGEVTMAILNFQKKPTMGHTFAQNKKRLLFKTHVVNKADLEAELETKKDSNSFLHCGLLFEDFYEVKLKQNIRKSSLKTAKKGQIIEWGNLDNAPLTSINCAAWSLHDTKHYLFLGGSSGLCRILTFSA